jgi:hypothetical protein
MAARSCLPFKGITAGDRVKPAGFLPFEMGETSLRGMGARQLGNGNGD